MCYKQINFNDQKQYYSKNLTSTSIVHKHILPTIPPHYSSCQLPTPFTLCVTHVCTGSPLSQFRRLLTCKTAGSLADAPSQDDSKECIWRGEGGGKGGGQKVAGSRGAGGSFIIVVRPGKGVVM